MMKNLQRGFTLIELLVVIAIIGILAAVVLASLNDARSSGSDAAVKQSLGNVRSQAEIVYNRNGAFTYDSVCIDPQVDRLIDGAAAAVSMTAIATPGGNAAAAYNQAACSDAATTWVATVPLTGSVSGTPKHWCVDSTGNAKQIASNIAAAATVCP